MKNFKFKINFLFSLFKKIKLTKRISGFFEIFKTILKIDNIKKKTFEKLSELYFIRFKIRYFIFLFSLLFFYYLIYLSFPGILHDKSDQNYLTKLLKNQYDLEFSLTPEISYSILPKPHFQINDVVIFNNIENFQKEIAQVKKLKIYLTQKNFLKKRQLKIKSVELYQTNFFINQTDINFLKELLIKGFKEKPMVVKKANLFYQDIYKGTISFLNLKKVIMLFNNSTGNDILTSEGEIFNIPFNITWKQDSTKLDQTTNIKFKKINLNILNSSKLINNKKKNKLQIYSNRSRYIINYDLIDKQINFDSNNSFIGNNKFVFFGKIFLDPFNFDINSSLETFKLKKLLLSSSLIKEILSNDFILNENFNGKINFDVRKLQNNQFFDNFKMNINFKGQTIDFSNSIFFNKKIANLIINKGVLYEEKNNLYFRGNVDFVVNDLNKLFIKLVVPKKNRHDLKKVSFEILIDLNRNEFKILNITNEKFKNKEFADIDELIYEFNRGAIKITNWIEFKIFANSIISSYSG